MSLPPPSARLVGLGALLGSSALAGYLLGHWRSKEEKAGDGVENMGAGGGEGGGGGGGGGGQAVREKLKKVSLENEGGRQLAARERWTRALERSNHISLRQLEASAENRGRIPWDYNWDRRDPQSLVRPLKTEHASEAMLEARQEAVKKATPKVTRRVILIRHGQYKHSEDKGDEEHKLTPLGREQANITGQRLREYLKFLKENLVDKEGNPLPVKIRVINSTMTRAKETTEEIMSQMKGQEISECLNCDLIREGAPMPPEPPISPMQWRPELYQFFVEGGRIEAGFRRYVHRAESSSDAEEVDVLVCHGNVIRYFICRALQLPPDAWLRFATPHASITSLHVRPSGRVGILMMGEAGHIPPDKITYV